MPPANDAPAKTIRPAMNMRRRPSRSAMRPPSTRKPPKVSVYAFTTHDRSSWEKCSAWPIEGSATLTIEASRTTTNCAAARRTSASQRRSVEVGMKLTPGEEVEVEFRFRLGRYGIDVPFVKPYSRRMTIAAQRPLRADARRNRERVLCAARAVFAAQGHEAQMDDVARQAEVGVGTVYRHFPTKEALIEALALEAFGRVAAQAKAALELDDPWEALTQTLWAGAEILAGDRALS